MIVVLVMTDVPGVRRLATYPAGVRLERVEDGGYRLSSGSDELAVLTPFDADPAVLIAALAAAAGRQAHDVVG